MAAMSGALVERPAGACSARALTLGELVFESNHAFVGTPMDSFSLWEAVGGRRRVVTYSTIKAEYSFDGRPPDASELTLRSLGGIVDGVGQVVPGEAVLRRGATAAVFVRRLDRSVFAVTAMAQGHYPLVTDPDGTRRLFATPAAREAAGRDGAVQRLDKRTVQEVEGLVLEELSRGKR
jgi:hypothetical protein